MSKVFYPVLLGSLFIALSCSYLQPKSDRDVASQTIAFSQGVRGLGSLNLDLWIKDMYEGAWATDELEVDSIGFIAMDVKKKFIHARSIARAVNPAGDDPETRETRRRVFLGYFFSNASDPKGLGDYAKRYQKGESLLNLAKGFVQAREEIRALVGKGDELYRRSAILLLQNLVEETLYVYSKRFPDGEEFFSYDTNRQEAFVCLRDPALKSQVQTIKLGDKIDFEFCTGDVVLSKGGSGSSSLLARIPDYPGNYSHSTVAFTPPRELKELVFFEALIEDGNKFRRPQKDYVDHAKTKLAIYRWSDDVASRELYEKLNERSFFFYGTVLNAVKKRVLHEKGLVLKLKGREGPLAENWDSAYHSNTLTNEKLYELSFHVSAFPYDFSMDANDDSKLACPENATYLYKYAGISSASDLSPYPATNWSSVSGSTKSFFESFLNIHSQKFPAPSDVELNRKFDLAGYFIKMDGLDRDRVDQALIDVLIGYVETNPKVEKQLNSLEGRFDESLSPQNLEKLKSLFVKKGLFPYFAKYGITERNFGDVAKQIPSGINAKQLVFFALLNEYLTPRIRKLVSEAEGEIPFGQNRLRQVIAAGMDEASDEAAREIWNNVDRFLGDLEKILIQ